ncbi:hypothetical protein [Streptomyces sp. NPDC007883]
MDTIQQHMLDSARAARHGGAPPPLPGRCDLAAVTWPFCAVGWLR